jgi:hypothetical protein
VPGAQPVRLALSSCGRFAALILLLHGTAALCFLTVLTGWSGIAAALLMLALGVSAAWNRALLRGRRSPRAIEIHPSGEACRFADGATAAVRAIGGSGITRHWVALGLDSPLRRSLLVAAGMLPPDAFRLLRLWALWGKLPGVAWRQLPAGR